MVNKLYGLSNDQKENINYSLKTIKEDTSKVNYLINAGKELCSINNDKALVYLQEAISIATKTEFHKGLAEAYLWMGRVFYYKDNYDIATYYLDDAIEILKETSNIDLLAFSYFSKGEIYKLKGNYIEAYNMYKNALTLSKNSGNYKDKAVFLMSLGAVLLERERPREALEYFKEALEEKERFQDSLTISHIFSHIGKAFFLLEQSDSALYYYNKALDIHINLELIRNIASSKYYIGKILLANNKYSEAEAILKESLNYYEALEEKTGECATMLQIAVAKSKQGSSDAIHIARDALLIAKLNENPYLVSHAYEILSEITFDKRDYKNSYLSLKKHNRISDSIFTAYKERLISEFEAKFEVERKDSQIQLLESKSQNQRRNNLFLSSLAIALASFIILLISLFRYKSTAYKRKKALFKQESVIKDQKKELIEKENIILKEQLESKNRELASKALEMIRFNDTISLIIQKLESVNETSSNNTGETENIKKVIVELENNMKQNIWSEFEKIFKNIHSDFYDKILAICPGLTSTEIKTAALLKLNLNTKEIAAITFKSEGGIKTARYRLRKKLNLNADDKLVPFLMKI